VLAGPELLVSTCVCNWEEREGVYIGLVLYSY
jgi:hypothetical protein